MDGVFVRQQAIPELTIKVVQDMMDRVSELLAVAEAIVGT